MLTGKTCLLAVTCLLFEEKHLQHLENYLLLGYCVENIGNSLPTFRDNLSVPSYRFKNPNIINPWRWDQ